MNINSAIKKIDEKFIHLKQSYNNLTYIDQRCLYLCLVYKHKAKMDKLYFGDRFRWGYCLNAGNFIIANRVATQIRNMLIQDVNT